MPSKKKHAARKVYPHVMSTNTRSEFHGQGIALSGAGNISVGRDIIIGGQTSSDQDKQFLTDLYSTDPRDDKKRIERTKGGLLKDSYQWILEHEDFCRWRDNDESRLLWVKGDPGKGKTMLLCGIIDELDRRPANAGTMAYFFCQATDGRLNNPMAVLRGLVYMLLVQKPSLVASIRQKYDHAGKQLFEGVNAWDALSTIFLDLLESPSLKRVYLIIDALDECETNLTQLLRLVVQLSSSSSSSMRLIVSSRNWPIIEEALSDATQKTRLSLELNRQSVSIAVGRYIRFKTEQLARLKRCLDY
ncbi:hypothetical protein K4K49_013227 [Colletotrichum sp. SAR 10_70]|nr:hypothetical protein K4K50_008897 [Colletotrichum sp. SAR 10_71]KAI8186359.1 hypothetical protein K4K49_013227 [Colletotrichum sp. SAR 10_70]